MTNCTTEIKKWHVTKDCDLRAKFDELFRTPYASAVIHRVYKGDTKRINHARVMLSTLAVYRAGGKDSLQYCLQNRICGSAQGFLTICRIIEKHEPEIFAELTAEAQRRIKIYGKSTYVPAQMRHIDETKAAQYAYLDEHGYPSFVPKHGICPCCHKNVWLELTVEQAKHDIITNCPNCAHSFDD